MQWHWQGSKIKVGICLEHKICCFAHHGFWIYLNLIVTASLPQHKPYIHQESSRLCKEIFAYMKSILLWPSTFCWNRACKGFQCFIQPQPQLLLLFSAATRPCHTGYNPLELIFSVSPPMFSTPPVYLVWRDGEHKLPLTTDRG